jgi:molybdopterin-guanine dinucleotide biosynthesis protein A
MTRRECTGAILAGGAASRMSGEAKGLLRIGGSRILEHVAAALTESAGRIVISSNDPASAEWLPLVPQVADRRPGFGPLSGIHAALVAAQSDLLAVAWDMPFVSASLLRALRKAGELEGATVVAPKSDSPWGFEPLCAWYSIEALPHIEALLDAGDARAGAIGNRAQVLTLDVSSWGEPADLFLSVNTPEDLKRAESLVARMRP